MTAFSQVVLLPRPGTLARKLAWAFLVFAPLLYGCLALYMGQDGNWDLRNYHWYNAYAFWTGRLYQDVLPAQTPTFYNPTLDLPFYLIASAVSAKLAYFCLASFQGLNADLLFLIAHACLFTGNPVRKVGAAAALALMGVLGAGGMAQIGATFYDNVTSLGLLTSALIVVLRLEVFRDGKPVRVGAWAFAAGFPAGMMMGLKLPSVVFCVGLCAALLFLSLPWKRRIGVAFMFGIGVLAGCAATLGHWAYYLETRYGNPFFPYFNQIFKSPYAPLSSARDIQFLPRDWQDWLFFPYIFGLHPMRVGEIPWRDFRLPALYTLMPVAGLLHYLYGRKSKQTPLAWGAATQYLLWFATVSYFVWLFMFAIYRYAVPLEMVAPILLVAAVGLLPLRRKTRIVWSVVLLVFLAVTVQPGNWGRKDQWMDHAIEVTRPALPDTSDLMILMAGQEPYSHIVSAFPSHIPFVRIESNFTSLGFAPAMETLIRDRVTAHRRAGGKFLILIPLWQHKAAFDVLAPYGLRLEPRKCQEVEEKLYDNLDLCEVSPSTRSVHGSQKKAR